MTVQDFVTFETDVEPLDADGPHDESPPPGRSVAARLVSHLRDAGAHVSHDVTPWETYGWEFGVRANDVGVSCILQASDSWLLITHPVRSFWDRLRGRSFATEHSAVCLAVNETLRADPAVRNVRWYTRQEFERGSGRAAP